MIWQDVVVGFVNVLFMYAMIPQLVYGFKTKRGLISIQFSVLNILAMLGLLLVYVSFELYISIVLTVILIVLWMALFLQRVFYGEIRHQ
jgi:hypothetical protein